MENKSLDRALFSNNSGELLNWNMRHAIALGTARGLACLHKECTNHIIHCGVKPENILLDKDWVPKVSNFGLAKLIHRDQSYMMTTLKGTQSYLALEWIKNAPLTEKSDIFSFGIVLLELVVGRRSFDLWSSQQPKQYYLPAWAFDLVEESADLSVLAQEQLRKNLSSENEIDKLSPQQRLPSGASKMRHRVGLQ
ncbi:hypothetical protein L7F22_051201 [Adiantum nelumboides]|nr:hypothetical protein [Adiantum nelumboides]